MVLDDVGEITCQRRPGGSVTFEWTGDTAWVSDEFAADMLKAVASEDLPAFDVLSYDAPYGRTLIRKVTA